MSNGADPRVAVVGWLRGTSGLSKTRYQAADRQVTRPTSNAQADTKDHDVRSMPARRRVDLAVGVRRPRALTATLAHTGPQCQGDGECLVLWGHIRWPRSLVW